MKTERPDMPYSDQWVDCTGNMVDDIAVRPGEGFYPSMIQIDHYDNGGSILSTDARALAAMLVKAADSADSIDDARADAVGEARFTP